MDELSGFGLFMVIVVAVYCVVAIPVLIKLFIRTGKEPPVSLRLWKIDPNRKAED